MRLTRSMGRKPMMPAIARSTRTVNVGPRPAERCAIVDSMNDRVSASVVTTSTHGNHERK